jgi:hypothetical protein
MGHSNGSRNSGIEIGGMELKKGEKGALKKKGGKGVFG